MQRAWLLLVVACYRGPSAAPCSISCTTDCPDGLRCEGGVCVADGETCTPTFVAVATGTGFACAIDDAHALWCWGDNTHHVIAAGDQPTYTVATRIASPLAFDTISAGADHVCGLAAGALSCWGGNDDFQAGDVGGDVTAPAPIAVPGVTTWTAVSAGVAATCAIGDGRLFCWGLDTRAKLTVANGGDVQTPTEIFAGSDMQLDDWTAVSVGDFHTCAISTSMGVLCWGECDSDQCGPQSGQPVQSTPVVAMAGSALAVATTDAGTCAIDGDHMLWCWGYDGNAELGELGSGAGANPTPMLATHTPGWTQIRGTTSSFCGLAGTDVYCWGTGLGGALGAGAWRDRGWYDVATGAASIDTGWNVPPAGVAPLGIAPPDLSCAVIGGAVQCWGDNRFGQLARGGATLSATPAELATQPLFDQLALGSEHGCGIGSGGLQCWGSTMDGQASAVIAGNGSGDGWPRTPCVAGADCDVAAPKAISFATGASAVAAGNRHTCALHAGAITCWGADDEDQLGVSANGPRQDAPPIAGAAWQTLLPTGGISQCAVPATGGTYCWGVLFGQLLAPPVAQPPLDTATQVAAGTDFTCALIGGALSCFGDAQNGEFGNGSGGAGCGNGICEADETPMTCGIDCGLGPMSTLGCMYHAHRGVAGRADGVRDHRGDRGRVLGLQPARPDRRSRPARPACRSWSSTCLPRPRSTTLTGCTAVAVGVQPRVRDLRRRDRLLGRRHLRPARRRQAGSRSGADPAHDPRSQLPGDPWVMIVQAGDTFTCAYSQAGHVYCWGFDAHAGLGNGATASPLPVPIQAMHGA